MDWHCTLIYLNFFILRDFMPLMRKDSRELTEKRWVKRGERDWQRVSRWESNSGCCERSMLAH